MANDDDRGTNPSSGSVEEGPVAWMQPSQRDLYVSDERDQWHTVPLYRSPTLTEAEREAAWAAWCDYAGAARMHHKPTQQEIADGLFALLKRLGGER